MNIDVGDVSAVAKQSRRLIREWRQAYRAMRRASQVRADVQGASRARLTTANARYMRNSEDFDRKDAALREWAATVDPIDIDAIRKEEGAVS